MSFLGEGSATKIDNGEKVGTLIPTSLLEDLVHRVNCYFAPLGLEMRIAKDAFVLLRQRACKVCVA